MDSVGIFEPMNAAEKRIIINKGEQFGTIDGVICSTQSLWKLVFSGLKNGTAKLLCDTDSTAMYQVKM